jgi:Mn2+/Fe2+ NRAMP family transporter
LIYEAAAISKIASGYLGSLFMILVGLMLFGTQLTVLDSTSRIISENLVIIKPEINLIKAYYLVLWLQIIISITVFLFGYTDPVSLVVTGAVINAFAMVVHIALTYKLNQKKLPVEFQAAFWRKGILMIVWVFFVALGLYAIIEAIKTFL